MHKTENNIINRYMKLISINIIYIIIQYVMYD